VNIADYTVAYLRQLGVRHAFGVGGANIEDVYDALHRAGQGLDGILAKHEFSAGTMADGYCRAGEPLGVVLATSGGGAMNLVPALAEAFASRVPVLAIVGQTPMAQDGRGGFQDSSGRGGSIDAAALFSQVAVYCRRITSADGYAQHLQDAVQAACGETPGPAVLLIPKDVQAAPFDATRALPAHLPARAEAGATLRARLDAAVQLIDGAAVFIVAGDGVARHDARAELARLVERLGARVAVTPDARDVFDNRHPGFCGVTGVMGHPSVERAFESAQVCLLVGTRLPQLARRGLDFGLADKAVVSLHFEPSFVDGVDVQLVGDLRASLRALDERLATRAAPCVQPPVQEERLATAFFPGGRDGGLPFPPLLEAVAAELPEGANVFIDAGNTGASAVHYLRAPSNGRWVVALGMGGMGYTFGAAIGAAFANGRRTFVLAGDGAFYMHGLEIHTAVEHGLPITFLIFNNNAHAMCYAREQLYYTADYSFNRFQSANIGAGIAVMFPSIAVLRARTPSEIRHALRSAPPGPAILALDVDAREIPPFAPFLQALAENPTALRGAHEDRPRKAS
jgi:acetolactate synthase-1/2/3 large subunit